MSLLGNYRKKTGNDGYESLQLVDSHGDFSTGSGAGGAKSRVNAGAATRSPVRLPPDRASTMDSSGSAACGAHDAACRRLLQLLGRGPGAPRSAPMWERTGWR